MRKFKIGTRVVYRGSDNRRLGIQRGDKATVVGDNNVHNVYVTFDKWKHEAPRYDSAMNRKIQFGVPAYCLMYGDFMRIPCMFDGEKP